MGRDSRHCLVMSWHTGITLCRVLRSHHVLPSWYSSSSCRYLRDTVIASFCFNFSLLLAHEQSKTRGGGTMPVGKLSRSIGSTLGGPDLVQIRFIANGPHVCCAAASKLLVSSPASSQVVGLIPAPSALRGCWQGLGPHTGMTRMKERVHRAETIGLAPLLLLLLKPHAHLC